MKILVPKPEFNQCIIIDIIRKNIISRSNKQKYKEFNNTHNAV